MVRQVTNSCRGWRGVDLYVETTKIVNSWWICRGIFCEDKNVVSHIRKAKRVWVFGGGGIVRG